MEYNTVALKKYNQLIMTEEKTFTVSSTVQGNWIRPLQSFYISKPLVEGHKIYTAVFGSEQITISNVWQPVNDNGIRLVTAGIARETNFALFVPTSLQAGTYTIKCMIVDLTEIYGANNEPTEVDQFLTDYPEFNEYVAYKENGYFEKEYDTLVGKINKNLIDFPSRSSQGPATILPFQNVPTGKILTLSATLLPQGGNARVRVDWQESGSTHYEFGNPISSGTEDVSKVSFIIPSSVSSVNVMMQHLSGGMTIAYKDVQLEEGSTATEYEPYGWIEKEYNALTLKKSKNLFDAIGANLIYNNTSAPLQRGEGWLEITAASNGSHFKLFVIGELSDFIGKSIFASCDYPGQTIGNDFEFCSCDATGGNRRSLGIASAQNHTCYISNVQDDGNKYLCLRFAAYDKIGTFRASNIMIEEGSTETEYEPYGWL